MTLPDLNALQIIVFVIGVLLLASTWYAVVRGRATAFEAVRWSIPWTALCIFALNPSLSNRIARILRIDSGRFLALYAAVIVLFICLILLYARTRKLSREITLLVREIAIHRCEDAQAAQDKSKAEVHPDSAS